MSDADEKGKQCSKCLIWKTLDKFSRKSDTKDGYKYHCKECDKVYNKSERGQEVRIKKQATRNFRVKTNFKSQLRELLASSKKRSRKKDLPIDITLDFLLDLKNKQDNVCPISGMGFKTNSTNSDYHQNPYAVSIDRIDSSKGYTKDNVRLVLHVVNVMIGEYGLDYLLKIIKNIVHQQYNIDIDEILEQRKNSGVL